MFSFVIFCRKNQEEPLIPYVKGGLQGERYVMRVPTM